LAGAVLKFLAELKIMKRWAIYTALLYALALVLLSAPVVLAAFGPWGKNGTGIALNDVSLNDIFQILKSWILWLWLGVMVAGQMLLLLLPINIAERRLPARRKLKIPVIVTAFFLANLLLAGILSILCAAHGDKIPSYYDLAGDNDQQGYGALMTAIVSLLFFWLVWAIVFRNFAKTDDENTFLKRSTRWLLRGSILELLIACRATSSSVAATIAARPLEPFGES
jgi:hypothetical protein